MAQLAALNLKAWIDAHRHLLKPPVGNALVFKDTDFQVMIVGGPNSRDDYHVDPYEELFYQLEGDIVVRIIEDGRPRDVAVKEGDLFLLPPLVPHSPQRGPDTVGMVVERSRPAGDVDRFRWHCAGCGAMLHEVSVQVSDLGTQLKPVLETMNADRARRTCKACGAFNPPPAPARSG